ncbi:hypothetical protein [Galbitalea soli]|uniref:Uncharacterized protein n=1 Tax=Galbitalea soli TaxID=1268042 RepID=A0A7C9PM81_9MICO|nr:hypothetical protein [Galbitalea soli]NEM90794.1 hypothetical protein [Galbitalea soli]NYJ31512.1 hypothetical protein [Galbitalea soli]
MTFDGGVWIVIQDSEADNPILGVFASESEAAEFARDTPFPYPRSSILYGHYKVGYRFDGGGRRFASTES